jgi:3',5'-cyclic AMP phosphodiesterase CpdA
LSLLLAHLSDAHIGPLPRPQKRELLGKRVTGYLNWTRGRHLVHDMDALRRLVADLKSQHPGHVAMTGDILNIGLKAEFPPARSWLETLGGPQDVSFVPGNHDAYVHSALPYLATTFAPWTTGDCGLAAFPYLRVREGVALIGLSSAVPTAPLIASGRIGPAQLAAAADLLNQAARDGLIRVVLIHHPPNPGGAKFGRGLSDAESFAALIRRLGAELVLHGHNHRLSVRHLPGPVRQVPIIGVASASAVHGTAEHRASYNLFRIEGSPKNPQIRGRVRGLMPGGREIGELRPIAL